MKLKTLKKSQTPEYVGTKFVFLKYSFAITLEKVSNKFLTLKKDISTGMLISSSR